MGFTAAMMGGTVGFGIQMFSNAIRKIPLSREPWLHATYFTIGAAVGNWLPKYEKSLVEDINELRAKKGLPPLVGTRAWIAYQIPEDENPLKRS